MDDEKNVRAEFPVGDSGKTAVLRQPSEGQVVSLLLLSDSLRADTSGKALTSMVLRAFRILEKLAGPEEWDKLQDGLLDEAYSVTEVVGLVEQAIKFPWPGQVPPEPPPVNALAPEPPVPATFAPPRPEPRLVDRG